MPQPYNNAVITDKGLALLTKAQAGQCAIEFTRMAGGDGTYTADEKEPSVLQGSTALKSQKNSWPLSSVTVQGGGIQLTALITNQDPVTGAVLVDEGYCINEIGLYAKEKDGDSSTEVLYSITTAVGDGDYIPAYTGSGPVQIVQEYRTIVSRGVEVSILYSGAAMLADGDASNATVTFRRAAERAGIQPGDTLALAFGKLSRLFEDMSGATADSAGKAGLVPSPAAGEQEKFLCGDGTWKETPTSQGATGATGPGITATVIRNNFLEEQWETFGDVGHTETWSGTSGIRNGTRVGDILLVTGTSTDGGRAHIAVYRSDTASGELHGTCIAHVVADRGLPGQDAIAEVRTVQLSTGWSGESAPYTQTVTVPGVTTSSTVLIDVEDTVTAEQMDAYINAKIAGGGQDTGSVTLKAFGDKPSVAVPIKILIMGV